MAGKGSSPRNCFSRNFKDNYDDILWSTPKVMDPTAKRDPLWKVTYYRKDGFVKIAYFFGATQEIAIELFKKAYSDEGTKLINAELYIE